MIYDKKLIGTRIMQRRKANGFTQEQLAERIGLSKNHISTVERGVCLPTTNLIFKICDVLGETPDFYLIGKSNGKTDEITDLVKTLPLDKQNMLYLLLKTYIDND